MGKLLSKMRLAEIMRAGIADNGSAGSQWSLRSPSIARLRGRQLPVPSIGHLRGQKGALPGADGGRTKGFMDVARLQHRTAYVVSAAEELLGGGHKRAKGLVI